MADSAPFLKSTIAIDGTWVPILIVRFDFESREAFTRDYRKLASIWDRNQAFDRLALVKAGLPTHPEKLEDEPKEKEAPDVKAARESRNTDKLRVHEENIALALAMRDLDETPEKRAQREQLDEENNAIGVRLTRNTFERYVTVDPEFELIDSAGRPVKTGLDLLRSFPTQALYSTVLAEVLIQNTLAASLKKKLGSPSGSDLSLIAKSATSPAVSGDQPAPTVPSASISASAAPEAVMEGL